MNTVSKNTKEFKSECIAMMFLKLSVKKSKIKLSYVFDIDICDISIWNHFCLFIVVVVIKKKFIYVKL